MGRGLASRGVSSLSWALQHVVLCMETKFTFSLAVIGGERRRAVLALWGWVSSSSPCWPRWSPLSTQKVTGCLGEGLLTGCPRAADTARSKALCRSLVLEKPELGDVDVLLAAAGLVAEPLGTTYSRAQG